jgi:hypothetical protein
MIGEMVFARESVSRVGNQSSTAPPRQQDNRKLAAPDSAKQRWSEYHATCNKQVSAPVTP